jgi:hypothetical protein
MKSYLHSEFENVTLSMIFHYGFAYRYLHATDHDKCNKLFANLRNMKVHLLKGHGLQESRRSGAYWIE